MIRGYDEGYEEQDRERDSNHVPTSLSLSVIMDHQRNEESERMLLLPPRNMEPTTRPEFDTYGRPIYVQDWPNHSTYGHGYLETEQHHPFPLDYGESHPQVYFEGHQEQYREGHQEQYREYPTDAYCGMIGAPEDNSYNAFNMNRIPRYLPKRFECDSEQDDYHPDEDNGSPISAAGLKKIKKAKKMPGQETEEELARKEKRQKHVGKACVHCKKAHLACDESRPCKRCLRLCKDDCVDVEHKRRGRPRSSPKKDAEFYQIPRFHDYPMNMTVYSFAPAAE